MKESYAIETRHLTKRYGEQVAVNDVCLHVPKGHIYGLLGRNGAGKTSIMKLILQLMPATLSCEKHSNSSPPRLLSASLLCHLLHTMRK